MSIAAQVLLWVIAGYLAAGIVFGAAFVLRGAAAIDHAAHGSGIGFKIVILPASVALWPVLLMKWMRAARLRRAAR